MQAFRSALLAVKKMLRADDQLPAKRHSLRQVETYEVECRDFNSIGREASGIGTSFAFAMACLPLAIALNVTLLTVQISLNTAFPIWTLMWACYIGGAFFSISAWRKRGELKRFMQEIRDNQVAAVAAKVLPLAPDLTVSGDPSPPPSPVSVAPDIEEC